MFKHTFAIVSALTGLAVAPAFAQSRTYVKSTGNDANDCFGPATACSTFPRAISQATAKGVVMCLDSGFFGALNITFSIHVNCEGFSGQTGFNFNSVNIGANDVVVLEGIEMDMRGFAGASPALTFTGSGTLHLRNSTIGNSGIGLSFAPTGGATLYMANTTIYNNTGSGFQVQPTAGGFANVHVRNSRFERNLHGIFADGSTSTVGINVNISDSLASGNSGNGFGASSIAAKAPVTMSIISSHISGNLSNGLGAAGVAASGPGSAIIAVGSSMITANNNGLATGGTGQILTYGNNQLRFNANNGSFTGTVGLQ